MLHFYTKLYAFFCTFEIHIAAHLIVPCDNIRACCTCRAFGSWLQIAVCSYIFIIVAVVVVVVNNNMHISKRGQ